MDSVDNTIRKPFIEHVREVQTRLTWSVVALLIGAGFGYFVYEELLYLIQKPLGQPLYYTSPTGGFSFIFKLCISFGLVVALPVLVYHFIKFLGPMLRKFQKSVIIAYLLWSADLAFAGVLFAYFVSLPAALRFLTNFGGQNIESLITADEYFNFALAYLAGFAILFQLPLAVLFINRIRPLKPRKMIKAQRFIILGSFIVAAVLTPTPDPFNQTIMALPIVALYQLSVLLVWWVNRKHKEPKLGSELVPLETNSNQSEEVRQLRQSMLASFTIDAAHRSAMRPIHSPIPTRRFMDVVAS
jgi:sec-independent protein translocase protein TatC